MAPAAIAARLARKCTQPRGNRSRSMEILRVRQQRILLCITEFSMSSSINRGAAAGPHNSSRASIRTCENCWMREEECRTASRGEMQQSGVWGFSTKASNNARIASPGAAASRRRRRRSKVNPRDAAPGHRCGTRATGWRASRSILKCVSTPPSSPGGHRVPAGPSSGPQPDRPARQQQARRPGRARRSPA
jgi:hypothetical protein